MSFNLNLNPTAWYAAMKDKTIFPHAGHITIERCGDIHPQDYPRFPNATSVTMDRCDKNFVFYWLHEGVFPNINQIYLNSHPCEPQVLHRFPHANFYLSKSFGHYKTRWAETRANLVLY